MTTIFNQSGQTVGVQVNGRLPVTGGDVLTRAYCDFSEWERSVMNSLPDDLVAEWDAMSVQMRIYLYNREASK